MIRNILLIAFMASCSACDEHRTVDSSGSAKDPTSAVLDRPSEHGDARSADQHLDSQELELNRSIHSMQAQTALLDLLQRHSHQFFHVESLREQVSHSTPEEFEGPDGAYCAIGPFIVNRTERTYQLVRTREDGPRGGEMWTWDGRFDMMENGEWKASAPEVTEAWGMHTVEDN